MNMTYEQATHLISLPKKIVEKDRLVDELIIHQRFPVFLRYTLLSDDDEGIPFLLEIKQSSKDGFRISLHHQENEGKIGLIRIDYSSGHKNPEIANEFLPEKFYPYVGAYLSNTEAHIHYHVQGYKSLSWAIPLSDDDFKIKKLDKNNLNRSLSEVIKLFAQMINIETEIYINRLLI